MHQSKFDSPFVLIFLFSLVTYSLFLINIGGGVSSDEGIYLLNLSDEIAKGRYFLFKQDFPSGENLAGYIFYLIYKFTGVLRLGPLIVSTLENLLFYIIIYRISKDSKLALILALGFLFAPWRLAYSLSFSSVTGVVGLVLIYLLIQNQDIRRRSLFLSVALLYYPTLKLIWLYDIVAEFIRGGKKRIFWSFGPLVVLLLAGLQSKKSIVEVFFRGSYNYQSLTGIWENLIEFFQFQFLLGGKSFGNISERKGTYLIDYLFFDLFKGVPVLGWLAWVLFFIGLIYLILSFSKFELSRKLQVIFVTLSLIPFSLLGASPARVIIFLPFCFLVAGYGFAQFQQSFTKYRVYSLFLLCLLLGLSVTNGVFAIGKSGSTLYQLQTLHSFHGVVRNRACELRNEGIRVPIIYLPYHSSATASWQGKDSTCFNAHPAIADINQWSNLFPYQSGERIVLIFQTRRLELKDRETPNDQVNISITDQMKMNLRQRAKVEKSEVLYFQDVEIARLEYLLIE